MSGALHSEGAKAEVERIYGAIVITDVYGFTAAVSQVEEQALARVRSDLAAFARIAEEHGGRVLADRGDGLKLFFPSPVEAMRASLEMQDLAYVRNQSAGSHPVRHRIGLHVGDVAVMGDSVSGVAVAVAARLQEFARPGTVAYTMEVHRTTVQAARFSHRFVGPQRFKGVPFSVTVYLARPERDATFDEDDPDLQALKDTILERKRIDWAKIDRGRAQRKRAFESVFTRTVLVVLMVCLGVVALTVLAAFGTAQFGDPWIALPFSRP